MKTKFLILVCACLFGTTQVKAQITLDINIDTNGLGYVWYPAKISNNETKFVFLDTINDKFSLYNLDLTPFLTNIPVPYSLCNNGYFYHIMYITRTLFDCDSTNIEYLFAAQNQIFKPLWVMRTDGTVLLYADSAQGPYCLGCPGGTTFIKPILQTENGTKLIVMKCINQTGIYKHSIYSLCGTLPVGEDEFDFTNQQQEYVRIFPNPTTMQLNFQIMLPDNLNQYELVILDSESKELRRQKVEILTNYFSIDVNSYSSGTYYFSLISKDKILQTGKFIITK